MTDYHEIWTFLSTSSLFWLALTLAAYAIAQRFYKFTNWNSLANPVAVAILIVILLITATGTSYKTYFDGAQFIHFLLGPTTVALAVLKIGFPLCLDYSAALLWPLFQRFLSPAL